MAYAFELRGLRDPFLQRIEEVQRLRMRRVSETLPVVHAVTSPQCRLLWSLCGLHRVPGEPSCITLSSTFKMLCCERDVLEDAALSQHEACGERLER